MDPDHHIDALLERYLHLLHEYTSLREQLSALQAGMYQDIARANFAAERGLRFGRDHYDERMQASRRLSISLEDDHGHDHDHDHNDRGGIVALLPRFTAFSTTTTSPSPSPGPGPKGEEKKKKKHEHEGERAAAAAAAAGSAPPETPELLDGRRTTTTTTTTTTDSGKDRDTGIGIGIREEGSSEEAEGKKKAKAKATRKDDPLNWFGPLLAPMPLLRQAQARSVRAVAHVVPRLASVSAEMAHVEVEVRRARKRRAKMEKERQREREQEGRREGREEVTVVAT
ncbi:hypothetical protein F5X96DRAFT_349226 [Biscogniauxia mediterranea]|nr:hypothetical protein F5X96DRAFT_349226 [Biscogniauxia mediterranea]